MPIAGIEPVTCALRMRCSTNWAKSADWGWASPIETKNFQKRFDGWQMSVYQVEGLNKRYVFFFMNKRFGNACLGRVVGGLMCSDVQGD